LITEFFKGERNSIRLKLSLIIAYLCLYISFLSGEEFLFLTIQAYFVLCIIIYFIVKAYENIKINFLNYFLKEDKNKIDQILSNDKKSIKFFLNVSFVSLLISAVSRITLEILGFNYEFYIYTLTVLILIILVSFIHYLVMSIKSNIENPFIILTRRIICIILVLIAAWSFQMVFFFISALVLN